MQNTYRTLELEELPITVSFVAINRLAHPDPSLAGYVDLILDGNSRHVLVIHRTEEGGLEARFPNHPEPEPFPVGDGHEECRGLEDRMKRIALDAYAGRATERG